MRRALLRPMCSASDTVLVFSYGSNSSCQLSGRVRSAACPALPPPRPAVLADHARVFVRNSEAWSGAVCNLVPRPGSHVLGALCSLSRAQLSRLDAFEGGYQQRAVTVAALDSGTAETALVYLMDPCTRLELPPSEAYLCAIWRTLREAHGERAHSLALLAQDEGGRFQSVTAGGCVGEWRHPGAARLSTVLAVCYEAGAARPQPWVLPRRAAQAAAALSDSGLSSAAQLVAAVQRGAAEPGRRDPRVVDAMDLEALQALENILALEAAPAESDSAV